MRIRHGFMSVASGTVGTAVVQMIIAVLVARVLGPEGRGLYSVFFSLVGLLAIPASLGLAQAHVYFHGQKLCDDAVIAGNTLLAFLLVSLVMASFPYFIFPHVSDLLPGFGMMLAWLLVLCAALRALDLMMNGLFLAFERFHSYSIKMVAMQLAILGATLPLLFMPLGARDAIELRVAAVAITAVIVLAVFFWIVRPGGIRPRLDILGAQVRFGSKNVVQNIIGLANYRIYLLILAAALGNEIAGYYSVAILFAEAVRVIPNAVGTVLLPKLSAATQEQRESLIPTACRHALWLSAAAALAIVIGKTLAVEWLFGEAYAPVTDVLDVVVAAAVIGIFYQILTRYFTSTNKQSRSITSGILALIAGVGAALTLIPTYGLMGGALAYLATNSVLAVAMILFFLKDTDVRPSTMFLPRKEDLHLYLSMLGRDRS